MGAEFVALSLPPLLIGTLESLTTPARMALVHALVPKDHLAAAIGLTGATFNGSRFVGPAIAGILISVSGSGVVLAVVAATFTQFCIALLAIKVQEPERKPGPWRDIFGDMATGIKYGFTHPGIRFLLIMLGITGLLIRPVIELMPGFAAQVFDSGSDGFAILMSAIGFGAMVSCLWVGMRGRTEGLTLKWPNDVLCPADMPGPLGPFRKVAGILAEPWLHQNRIEAIVVGVGINVVTPLAGFSPEIADRAAALWNDGHGLSPDRLLLHLLPHLEEWLSDVSSDHLFSCGLDALRRHSATLGREVCAPEEGISGVAEDIEPDGALRIRSSAGETHRILAGDVLPAQISP